MAIIIWSIPLPSIPSSFNVVLCLTYLAASILITSKNTALTLCTFIIRLQLTIFWLFLVFKVIIFILIKDGSISYDCTLYMSLGVSVRPYEADGWEFVRTLTSDLCSLVVSLLLMIGWIIRRNRVDEIDDKHIENLQVTGSKSPAFWPVFFIFEIVFVLIISPHWCNFFISVNYLCLIFIVCTAVGLYTWSLYFDLQGPIMNVITYTSLLISALFTSASFIVQIEFFSEIRGMWVDCVGIDNFNYDNPKFEESKLTFT